MRIAFLCVDNRETGDPAYVGLRPHLGSAPNALIQGFAELGSDPSFTYQNSESKMGSSTPEVYIISCLKTPAPETSPLGSNIFFHPIVLP